MNKLCLFISMVLLCAVQPLLAQERLAINGFVVDADANAVVGATVTLKETNFTVSTDPSGNFNLSNLQPGIFHVHIRAIGFQALLTTIDLSSSTDQPLTFVLKKDDQSLQTVEIYGVKEKSYKNERSFIGSRTETRLRDLPQSVSYATKELIADQGLMRVGDVVKNFSGVSQFTLYDDISIRGFRINGQSNTQLVNGMRSTSGFWKQPLVNYLERVEVLKGPASALFGNASPGGVINRVTKKPLDETRRSLQFSVGSFNNVRALADFTGPITKDKTLLYRLNIGYEDAQNFRDLQFDKNVVIAPSFSFVPSEATRVNFDMVYNDSRSRLDRGQSIFDNGDLYSTPISRSMNTANDFLNEQTFMVTASLNHQLTEQLSFNASYMKTGYSEDLNEHRSINTYAADGAGDPMSNTVFRHVYIRKGKRFMDNATAFLNYDLQTSKLAQKIILGYDYAQQMVPVGGSQLTATGYRNASNTGFIANYNPDQKDAYLLDINGNPVPNVPAYDLNNPLVSQQLQDASKYFFTSSAVNPTYYNLHAIYLQDQISLGKLQVLLGLRYEMYRDELNYKRENQESVHQDVLLPRLGLVYTLTPQINVYGTYVQGYNPQTASALANPNAGGPFDPLENDMTEFGIKSAWFDGKLEFSTAVYQINQRNTLYSANDDANPDLLVQIGKERSKGIEFDVRGQLLPNWSILASYAYNDARITEGADAEELDVQKPNAPKNTANLWTRYNLKAGLLEGLGIAFGTNFVDQRSLSARLDQTIPSFTLINAALYYSVGKVQLQANLNNIADKIHWVGGYDYVRLFPGAPRNFLLTLGYTF